MNLRKIAFIGSGNMSRAIISGLVQANYPVNLITATDPNAMQRSHIESQFGIDTESDNLALAREAEVIVLAVKPQLMEQIGAELGQLDLSDKLIISIAAGISAKRLDLMFTQTLNLVRVMPNTPALIGYGMSGLYAKETLCAQSKVFAQDLMACVGNTIWVATEADINTVIAASGSAPAYFFQLMDAMITHTIALGFDEKTARALVEQTAIGAAKMVVANPQTSVNELKAQVTSKGGTTAEAIAVFEQQQFDTIVATAMDAAIKRAIEMESSF